MHKYNKNGSLPIILTLALALLIFGCGEGSGTTNPPDSHNLAAKYGITVEALGWSGAEAAGLSYSVADTEDGLLLTIGVAESHGTLGAVLEIGFDESMASPLSAVGGGLLGADALTLLADTAKGELQLAVAATATVETGGGGELVLLRLDKQAYVPRSVFAAGFPADPPDDFLLIEYVGNDAHLSWSGKLQGDYNLDGRTDGFDIFPVAFLFQVDDTAPEFDPCVDGTGDGLINGLDVFPISTNFKTGITSYRLYQGLDSFSMEYVTEIPRESDFTGCAAEYQYTVPAVADTEATLFGLLVFDGVSLEESWMAFQPDGELSVEIDELSFYQGQAPTGMFVDCTVRHGRAPYQFWWTFGGGQTADTKEASTTWLYGGNYQIALTVTDDLGAEASHFRGPVEVLPPPIVEIDTATLTPLAGTVPLFVEGSATASGGVGTLDFVWTWGDGAKSYTNIAGHTYHEGGTFNVKLTVTDIIGQFDSRQWTVEPSYPPLDASNISATPTSGEIPFDVAFDIDPSGGKPPYYYSWDFPSGPTSPLKSPQHTFTFEGNHQVTCTVTDSLSNQVERQTTIQADPPYMTATIHADTYEANAPVTVGFWAIINGGQGPYEYDWDFGGGAGSTDETPEHLFLTAGHHTVRCTITDNTGYDVEVEPIDVYCPIRVKSLSLDVQPIINASCMGDEPGDCHNGLVNDAGLDLTDGVFWSNTVNKIAVRAGSHYVVQPYNADLSFLLRKIAYSHEEFPFDQYSNTGDGMPPTGKMQNQYIQVVGTWIDEGARDN